MEYCLVSRYLFGDTIAHTIYDKSVISIEDLIYKEFENNEKAQVIFYTNWDGIIKYKNKDYKFEIYQLK